MLNFILPFLILILVVVFIHEYGHYYFAKKYGVGVTDFSIGFGQEIFGWNDKSGTRWKICWIPLGGYVKFFGDRNVYSQQDHQEMLEKYSKEDQEKLFVTKPLYQRSLIVFGGPLANFLLAIVIFLSIYMFVGKDFTPALIDEVQKDSPAEVAGLMKNDVILEIDNNKVESILDVSKLIAMSTSEYIDFKVSRYDQEILFKIKPNLVLAEDNLGNKVNKRMVGIKLSPYKNEINHKLIDKLQLLRDDLGFPLVISSGYRCSEHPIEANKSKPGTHAEGIAVDIAVSHEKALELLYKSIAHGFKGIGVNQKGNGRFIHLDIAEVENYSPRPHIWSY